MSADGWLSKEALGKKIAEIRNGVGLTQTQLAEKLGWSEGQGDISAFERGKKRPTLDMLDRIATACGHGVAVFREGSEYAEGVAWGVRQMRSALENMERQVSQVPAVPEHKRELPPDPPRRAGGKPSLRRKGDDPEQRPG